MSKFTLNIPTGNGQQENKVIQSGEIFFLIGANGKGKSTLMHHFAKQNQNKVRRITAHRQVWLTSNAMDLTPAAREQSEKNIFSRDFQDEARWKDDFAAQRSQVTIFDLIDSENVDARKIADALRSGDEEKAKELAASQAPMSKMNDILRISNLDVQIQVDQGSKLLATKGESPPYSVAELSDGERNALLIIANVLTAPSGTLILLDEPERHLHRAIVSPLLSTLLTYRDDCAFVISTHDVSLPLDQDQAAALLVREYTHRPQSWTIDFIPAVEEMDEYTAAAVLGSRRKILFIEGGPSSLDIQIYQLLFPDVSIKPVGNCLEIERIVKGLNSSEKHHWISAVGIVDRDNRDDEQCKELLNHGIIPLDQYSVESIYYHPTTVKAVLNRVVQTHGIDPKIAWNDLTTSVIKSITPHMDRMAAKLVERKAHEALLNQAPNWRKILEDDVNVEFSSKSLLENEKKTIQSILLDKDFVTLISRYPIRETPALESVSKALGFQSQAKYEQAVRKMLIDCPVEKAKVLELLKPVTDYLKNLGVV
ncbi:MAG: ATP-binding cassette domain-containing protein [Sneathiella sp.]|nr:ATP-binding cassette domain-containing protein [Sneathiella sp.]